MRDMDLAQLADPEVVESLTAFSLRAIDSMTSLQFLHVVHPGYAFALSGLGRANTAEGRLRVLPGRYLQRCELRSKLSRGMEVSGP